MNLDGLLVIQTDLSIQIEDTGNAFFDEFEGRDGFDSIQLLTGISCYHFQLNSIQIHRILLREGLYSIPAF